MLCGWPESCPGKVSGIWDVNSIAKLTPVLFPKNIVIPNSPVHIDGVISHISIVADGKKNPK
jgi:hypothetical protein